MSEETPPTKESPRKSRKLLVVIFVVVILAPSLLIAWSIFSYQNVQCGLACGPPIDVPSIQSAQLIQSSSSLKTNCEIVTSNLIAHCQVSVSPGENGTILLNLKSENGDSRVQLDANSSATSFVQFASLPNCTYDSIPNFSAGGCIVLQSGTSFVFNYTVSMSLEAVEHVIFSIEVTKICCWR